METHLFFLNRENCLPNSDVMRQLNVWQVLDALGESLPCVSYDSWMVYIPEAEFLSRIGPTEFLKVNTSTAIIISYLCFPPRQLVPYTLTLAYDCFSYGILRKHFELLAGHWRNWMIVLTNYI